MIIDTITPSLLSQLRQQNQEILDKEMFSVKTYTEQPPKEDPIQKSQKCKLKCCIL